MCAPTAGKAARAAPSSSRAARPAASSVVLRRGLPEGPPQAAQEGMQAACGRAQGGRGAVQASYPDNEADSLAMVETRVAKKDPEAINFLGEQYFHGMLGLQKDMYKAVKLWTEAAELGSIEALYNLGNVYYHGQGVQEDKVKGTEFHEKAAMQGLVMSRHNLGYNEVQKDNYDRAVKHFLISAKLGDEDSVDNIKEMF
ncbi:hypothetical protein THAOC_08418, partial [Thalassiosira oceanica]